MKTILVPIDFSSATSRIVDQAGQLAEAFDGIVVLLHVVQLPHPATDYDLELQHMPELSSAIERSVNEQLDAATTALRRKGITARSVRRHGRPAAAILEEAKKLGSDFIVLGSHGHTAVQSLISGSTTSAVLKGAACPVLVVPSFGKRPAKSSSRKRSAARQLVGAN